jgi:hypothetical protein
MASAIHFLKPSAENGSRGGQFAISCMVKNAFLPFPSVDLRTAVQVSPLLRIVSNDPDGASYSLLLRLLPGARLWRRLGHRLR